MIPIDIVTDYQIRHLRLPDKRLSSRAVWSLEKMDRMGCEKSFPAIFQSRESLKGFYRLVNNKRLTPGVFQQSCSKSLEDMAGSEGSLSDEAYFILYQDTTFGKYHHRKGIELGYFNDPEKDNGMLIHSGVLTTSDFVPLGLPVQSFIVRDAAEYGKSEQRRERDFEEKESFKWVSGVEWAEGFEKRCGKKVIQVADCESDISELMALALEKKQGFIFRSQHDRRLKAGFSDKNLKAYLEEQEPVTEIFLPLLDEKGRSHIVEFEVRSTSVLLADIPDHPLQVIFLQQKNLYTGQKELSSLNLFTSLPIEVAQDVKTITGIYTNRWRTCEDFHKCLKSGCGIEQRQFESTHALFNTIALLSILAIRLLRLRHLAQNDPQRPIEQILDENQLKLAKHFCEKMLTPTDLKHCQKNTVLAFVLTIARLGGHQGIKQKGMPGWQTIWKGWNYFQTILDGIIISMNDGFT